MSATDESENLLDHPAERTDSDGWRVSSNPTRRPELGADELKTSSRSMQKGRRSSGGRKVDETEPPEAA